MFVYVFFENFRDTRQNRNGPIIRDVRCTTALLNWEDFYRLKLIKKNSSVQVFVYKSGYAWW